MLDLRFVEGQARASDMLGPYRGLAAVVYSMIEQVEVAKYKNHIHIRNLADLCSLDQPKWQVEGYIPTQSIVTLYGPPGSGKSFLALDMALSMAMAEPWKRRATLAGPVLYLACEGIAGMGRRVNSWMEYNGLEVSDNQLAKVPFYYTTAFSDLQGPAHTTDLIRAIEHDLGKDQKLGMVILDTLSRTLGSSDENDAGQMNRALDQLCRIREATESSIMILHHTDKSQRYERGSSVLRGACDTMLRLRDNESHVVLEVDKQRDWEQSEPLNLYLRTVGDSAVLTTDAPDRLVLTQRDRRIFKIICDIYDGTTLSYSKIKGATDEPETSLGRTLKVLTQAGMLVKGDGKRGGYDVVSDEPTEPIDGPELAE